MSVLVEAMTLVVPIIVLARRFPAWPTGFFQHLARPSAEHRYACSDGRLLAVSFFDARAAERLAAVLEIGGLREGADGASADFAFVDQYEGPEHSYDWLEWTRERSGFTHAWLSGSEPGSLAAPRHWTAEHSLRLKRTEVSIAHASEVCLADENGIETWLDFRTGRVRTATIGLPG